MTQTCYPITPVEITPGTVNAWTPVNVNGYVPSGATGVILHLEDTYVLNYAIGLRKNGSTDNRTEALKAQGHCWAAIGIDANRFFEAYIGHISYVNIYLVGYTMSGVTFFTNAYNKTPVPYNSWQPVNCSSEAPGAIGLIWEMQGNYSSANIGIRKNGSTDNRYAKSSYHYLFGAVIGCDASQICEIYWYGKTTWLIGYITDGCTFNTNATDVSLGTTGSWLPLTALPANSVMGFIEVISTLNYYFGLRKNGSTVVIQRYVDRHAWGMVECDTSYIIQGYISNLNVDFFVVGYATETVAAGYYHGLKVQGVGELALCDVGSHPLRIRKGGVTYGIELVAVDDPNASRIRLKTSAGTKAIRKYT